MADFLDGIRNGIVSFNSGIETLFADTRGPNRANPREMSSDPTATIDSETGQSTTVLGFPHDRPKYYMSFAFEEYRRPTQFEGLKSNGTQDYIVLPLPQNLRDNNSLSYGDVEGNFLTEALTRIVQDKSDMMRSGDMKANLEGLIDSLNPNDLNKAGEAASGWGAKSAIAAARAAANVAGEPGLVDTALQLPGLADNPFTTVAFSGPRFKTHSFFWRLSAKSEEESVTIKNIVNTFKRVAHPDLLSAGLGGFYKYPWIVWPKFCPDESAEYMYRFKPCVITDVNINYSPNDRPGFYAISMAPIEVILELHLKEIEIWRNGSNNSIRDTVLSTASGGDFDSVALPPTPVRDLGSVD